MPTIIDTIVTRFALDGTSSVRRDAKDMQSAVDGITQAFQGLEKGAIAFFAMIGSTAAMKVFIADQIEAAAAVDRLSKNLNTATETLSAWSNESVAAGGTAAGVKNTFEMLRKAQTELMLTGNTGLIPYFSALGVAMSDSNGKAQGVEDMLLSMADGIKGLDRTTAFNMLKMMGVDEGTINILVKGRKETELLIARQKEQNALTKAQGEQASRVREQTVRLSQSWEAFGRSMLEMAMPAIETTFNWLSKLTDFMRDNKETTQAFLLIVSGGLAAIGLAAIPINTTILAVTGLAAGIALLYNDYQTFKRGGETLIDWAKWEPGITAAKNGIKWLGDALDNTIYRAIAGVDVMAAIFSLDWDRAKFAAGEFMAGHGAETPPPPKAPAVAPSNPAVTPAQPAAGGQTRGQRNNNPGNLNFAGQRGAELESGPNARFAKFQSMAQGTGALIRQIGLYVSRGNNTLRGIISTFAPPSENNTQAYIAQVAKALGITPDTPIDVNNQQQMQAVVDAISSVENRGWKPSAGDFSAGWNMAHGVRGASGAAATPSMTSGRPVAPGGGGNSTMIGTMQIDVHTQATDADGIAQDIGPAVHAALISQSVSGVD